MSEKDKPITPHKEQTKNPETPPTSHPKTDPTPNRHSTRDGFSREQVEPDTPWPRR